MPSKPQSGRPGGNAGKRLDLTGSNLLCVTLIRMSTTDILTLIDAEIAKLHQARTLLAGSQGRTTTAPAKKPAKRKLSAAARARMAAAASGSGGQRPRKAVKAAAAAKPEKKAAAQAKKRGMSAQKLRSALQRCPEEALGGD
jgi:hypothetical protein